MIIFIDELVLDMFYNIVWEFVLCEGIDYGEIEVVFVDKVEQVIVKFKSGEVILVYLELYDIVDICFVDSYQVDSEEQVINVNGFEKLKIFLKYFRVLINF